MRFEDAGRVIDREIARLVKYLDRKVKPAARRDMAEMLRKASSRLSKLAADLEKAKS